MRALLVANDGGHLTQLLTLQPRLDLAGDVQWASIDSPHARTALQHEHVHWLRPANTHDLRTAWLNTVRAARVLAAVRPDVVVSTGSSLAVSFLPLAATMGSSSHYIESATRLDGPSLAGRLVSRHPGVRLYTQHRNWARGRWHYSGSVFDAYAVSLKDGPTMPRRAVVMVGTSQGYGFRRMLEQVIRVLPPDCEVLWQTGSTEIRDLRIKGRAAVPEGELRRALRESDVVVSHAGTGSALTSLQEGKVPVLIPRRASHSEHVDDHQLQTGRLLAANGLAVVAEAEELRLEHLEKAASLTATYSPGRATSFPLC